MRLLNSRRMGVATLGIAMVAAGCGGSSAPAPSAGGTGAATAESALPPTAALDPAQNRPQPPRPADDPESLIAEITRLRTVPDTVVEIAFRQGERRTTGERPPTDEERHAERTRRLEKIVELATLVVVKTHQDPRREQLLNNAVHYLADARLQLALLGDAEQAALLAEDAEALHQRDPLSFAAVEAAYKVVQLAESHAERHGRESPEWVRTYARQARLFAEKFPQEQARGAVSLIAAGRRCEQLGHHDEARRCYLLVEEKYPGTPFVEQLAGVLRRLRLPGQPLELAGPTLDGGFFSIERLAGKAVLVVFWSSASETFRRDLPELHALAEQFDDETFEIVGVSLDQNEITLDHFLAESNIAWTQIFFSDPEQRGGRNPVARYYGVQTAPTYWLVDPRGTVVEAPADVNGLSGRVQALLSR